MTVQELINYIDTDITQDVKIQFWVKDDLLQTINIRNTFQLQVYTKFKVASFRATEADAYEISLAFKPAEIITE